MQTKKTNNDKSHYPKIGDSFGTEKVCAFAFPIFSITSITPYLIGAYRQGITLGGVALFAE